MNDYTMVNEEKRKRIDWLDFAKGIAILLVFAVLLGAAMSVQEAQAAKGKLSKKELTLREGEKQVLRVTGIKGKKQWKSSAPEVATVNQKGVVRAKKAGQAVITVKVKKWKGKCRVTVVGNSSDSVNENSQGTAPSQESTEESDAKPENAEDKEYTDSRLAVTDTGRKLLVAAEEAYWNWDGNSNVSQFVDCEGCFAYAYEDGDNVTVVRPGNGTGTERTVTLKKQHPLFGDVISDTEGNFYLATGETNEGGDTARETVFISKYDKDGNLLATIGDNGSSSLDWYYDSSFYTKSPFHAGNCDMALNGDFLTLHYARTMYSNHQSDSVFTINTRTMEKVVQGSIYQSHCFAERVIPFGDGFVYAGEGDAYNRAFTITKAVPEMNSVNEGDVFHFWVEQGKSSDMSVVNDNFARMGGLAAADDSKVAFLGLSAKAMDASAKEQAEQLFVQIFYPEQALAQESSYVTSGMRSGYTGIDGTEPATDYGVQWLTDYGKEVQIEHPQIVSDGNGRILVLYEKKIEKEKEYSYGGTYSVKEYQGVYCMELDANGTVTKEERCLSDRLQLNPYQMPVYAQGKFYWIANKKDTENQAGDKLYICCVE